jgi:putative zinc finger protein
VSHLGQRLSALIDGELNHQQRERVLAHLAHCEACRGEAAALRMLKQRMHALGEATADTALTDRLIAVAGVAGPAPWRDRLPLLGRRMPGAGRWRWPVRSLLVTGLAVAGLGVPAAAFMAGGGQQEPGPSVTPAIDMYMLQHEISTGQAPAAPSPTAIPPAPAGTGTGPVAATAAPEAPAISSGLGVLTAAGAVAVSTRAAAALIRVAAASTRVAAASTGVAAAASRPHPVMSAAGAR